MFYSHEPKELRAASCTVPLACDGEFLSGGVMQGNVVSVALGGRPFLADNAAAGDAQQPQAAAGPPGARPVVADATRTLRVATIDNFQACASTYLYLRSSVP